MGAADGFKGRAAAQRDPGPVREKDLAGTLCSSGWSWAGRDLAVIPSG